MRLHKLEIANLPEVGIAKNWNNKISILNLTTRSEQLVSHMLFINKQWFFRVRKREAKSLTSKWELPRPLAVSIYKCLPKMLTWTLMYKLSIVTDHSDKIILVKPGKQTHITSNEKKIQWATNIYRKKSTIRELRTQNFELIPELKLLSSTQHSLSFA